MRGLRLAAASCVLLWPVGGRGYVWITHAGRYNLCVAEKAGSSEMLSFARFEVELTAEQLCGHVALDLIQNKVAAQKCQTMCSKCDVNPHDHHTASRNGGFAVLPSAMCPFKKRDSNSSWTEWRALHDPAAPAARLWMALFRDPWSRLVSGYTSKFRLCQQSGACLQQNYLPRFSLDDNRHSFLRFLQTVVETPDEELRRDLC